MGGLRVSNEVILVEAELTYGTDPTPSASTNAVLVRNPSLSSEGLRMNDRAAVRAGLGQLQKVYGGQLKRFRFECEVKGSGAAGTAPEIAPLLTSCGMAETLVASTSATYLPANSAHGSSTIYWYEGGRKLHILTGCVGNPTSIRQEAGGLVIIGFEFVGHYTQPTDQSQPTPTYNSTVPRAAIGMAIAINGVTAIVAKSLEWNFNNVIAMPPSISAADGYGQLLITSRDITGTIVIESELDSVIDIDALHAAGTKFATTSGALGSTAGNILTISTPASSTYVTDTEPGEADGLRLRTVNLAIDDGVASNFSLAFT
jgi:hypothetical protein